MIRKFVNSIPVICLQRGSTRIYRLFAFRAPVQSRSERSLRCTSRELGRKNQDDRAGARQYGEGASRAEALVRRKRKRKEAEHRRESSGPTTNKLLAQWQGPYSIVRQVGAVNYEVDMSDKRKRYRTFHINMLKEWHKDEPADKKKEAVRTSTCSW